MEMAGQLTKLHFLKTISSKKSLGTGFGLGIVSPSLKTSYSRSQPPSNPSIFAQPEAINSHVSSLEASFVLSLSEHPITMDDLDTPYP